MTDCPTNEMDLQGAPTRRVQPYTVILMMPDEMRSNEACAADWIRRVWVYGDASDTGVYDLIEAARRKLADLFGWIDDGLCLTEGDPYMTEEEIQQRMDELEPVAIYAGHIFDVYES